jgi:Fe-S-cluster containining protein
VSEPWYAAGLRFECKPDCGACCTNHDDYAYVYLVGDDLTRLAALLELSPDAFAQRYTEIEEGERFLRMDDPACPFLDGSRCTVYEARPRQCRTFPFWDESLASRARWRGMSKFCPGIGKGERHSLSVIQSHLDDRYSGD